MMKRTAIGLALLCALLCVLCASPAAFAATVVNSWSDLQSALDAGGEVQLGGNVTAGSGDSCLVVRKTVILDLNGHTIDRGLAGSGGIIGGNVITVDQANLTIRDSAGGGKITGGNDKGANMGGGVCVLIGTFIMEGGEISGNRAVDAAGGVETKQSGYFIMKGGKITGNTGGGVLVAYGMPFRISGSPVISGNYDDEGEGLKEANVMLPSVNLIQIDGKLESGAKIGVTMGTGTGVFTSGLPGNGDISNFISDNPDYMVMLTDQKEAKLGVVYSVVSGDGQTWTRGTASPASFTIKGKPSDKGTFDKFTGIRVNGVDVAPDRYEAAAGSVVVKLKASYLDGLKPGTHKLTAVFTDGEAKASFKVAQSPGKQPGDPSKLPKTGDDSQPLLWALLAIVCAGVAVMIIRRKRK